jgi:hypothetical protein
MLFHRPAVICSRAMMGFAGKIQACLPSTIPLIPTARCHEPDVRAVSTAPKRSTRKQCRRCAATHCHIKNGRITNSAMKVSSHHR